MKSVSRRDFIRRVTCVSLGTVALPTIVLGANGCKTKGLSANSDENPEMSDEFEPAYLKLHQTGELKERAAILQGMMASCSLCPRECGVNRLKGQRGICGSTSTLRISSYNPHFGEERPLVAVSYTHLTLPTKRIV